MNLIWFIYSNHNDTLRRRYRRRWILGIVLGELYGKYHILETSKLSDYDVLFIRTYINDLLKMFPEQRMKFLREHLSMSFRRAYKTIYKNRIEIMDEYPIEEIKVA